MPDRQDRLVPDPPAHRRFLEALFLLARSCHAPVGSSTLLEGIMDCLLSIAGADRGFILLDRADDEPRVKEGRELVPAVGRKVDIAGSDRFSRTVARQVLASGRPMLIPDAAREKDLAGQDSVLASRIRSVLAAPLLAEGKPVGVIYLDTITQRRPFADDDLELVTAAAEHVVAALANSRERERLRRHASQFASLVEQEIRREFDVRRIVGTSPPIKKMMESVELLAPQETSALLLGESGTGKELVARALHDLSGRRGGPFVAVNCMALSEGVLESELFGHEKGAFTGATERRMGRFEMADGGTIFLDEIGELSPALQVKLLRVLQERVVDRVGGGTPRSVDVRLVCATNANLLEQMNEGKFRRDLYYRIAVFTVSLPPLRERREDVAALVHHFIAQFAPRMGKAIRGIEADALAALMSYDWPGNIRELRNVIERAFVLEKSDRITLASLPFSKPEPRGEAGAPSFAGKSLSAARDSFERYLILDCLARHNGSITLAAQELDIPRSTIYRKLEGWGEAVDKRGA